MQVLKLDDGGTMNVLDLGNDHDVAINVNRPYGTTIAHRLSWGDARRLHAALGTLIAERDARIEIVPTTPEIEALADEAERGYDPSHITPKAE